ncbi:hypothetical protein JF50_25500 [Pseudoalteromonas luteoviolacea]|uniref:Uncharacterized protein n=1 Tax=Pseudoalteromonas luteoviolacea TaxID=43657 RepID=A0A0C1QJ85_9GAMM|nr:hypothetical protein JF50_25500 [Pseudoalteromonas luteoviolacea]
MVPDLRQGDEGEIAAEPSTSAKWLLTFVRVTKARLQLNPASLQNGFDVRPDDEGRIAAEPAPLQITAEPSISTKWF